ncbi:hypothetical protein M378DRAFT_166179 [Amanita muscaria Koide BX008]|uniref:Uncharacterized protein n=1 Tax=Amanita muscaria (strain Koide BX008) TaxID=946122 RepID=A0A0C2WKI0_AMAMK|nr:hypothetical protein M378DRAFT_166179 [Amanita muscaria Koide BX008]
MPKEGNSTTKNEDVEERGLRHTECYETSGHQNIEDFGGFRSDSTNSETGSQSPLSVIPPSSSPRLRSSRNLIYISLSTSTASSVTSRKAGEVPR